MQGRSDMMNRFLPLIACLMVSLVAGCMVGPNYERPAAITAPVFKEAPTDPAPADDGWKAGQPSDQVLKGDWWLVYQDPQLDALEAHVNDANQTLKIAEQTFRSARAAIGVARSHEVHTLGAGSRADSVRQYANEPYSI